MFGAVFTMLHVTLAVFAFAYFSEVLQIVIQSVTVKQASCIWYVSFNLSCVILVVLEA